jgi:hypothetical protein
MEVGDFVRGRLESDAEYSVTNSKMTRGIVTDINDDFISVRVLEHAYSKTGGSMAALTQNYSRLLGM